MFLDLSGGICLVIGGGGVALRKVRMLREFGGEVRVVSPRSCAGIEELAARGEITVERRAYQDGDLIHQRNQNHDPEDQERQTDWLLKSAPSKMPRLLQH